MTSVKYDYGFLAGYYQDNELQFNNYNLNLHLYVNTESDNDQQTAFDRMNLMIYDIVENSIFVHEDDTDQIVKLLNADFRVLTFSEPGPIDQVVQVTLVDKLNAITDEHLHIFESEFSSLRGGFVKYMYFSPEEVTDDIISDNPCKWWNDSDPRFTTHTQTDVFNFKQITSWKDLDLEWEDDIVDETFITNDTNIITMKIPDESR